MQARILFQLSERVYQSAKDVPAINSKQIAMYSWGMQLGDWRFYHSFYFSRRGGICFENNQEVL